MSRSDPAPQDDRGEGARMTQKNLHMIIFSLQDIWQTNKINTKHVPNPNHRLD